MKRGLLFVDALTPRPYDESTPCREGMGGTEQMVLRIATGLAREHDVRVAQAGRATEDESAGVRWRPLAGMPLGSRDLRSAWRDSPEEHGPAAPDTVVLVQAWKLVKKARRAFPDARLLVWLHAFPGRRAQRRLARFLDAADAELVCVSDSHLARVGREIAAHGPPVRHRCRRLFNAVEDHLRPDDTPRETDLLICLSSPHKGRDEVLRSFAALRDRFPDVRLLMADPGYWPGDPSEAPAGVSRVGALARPDVLALLRRASCLFYPQATFAETFGLVFAEALAVGTPVLAHPLGAAAEVLPRACWIDGTDPASVVDRFAAWRRDGAPHLTLPERFRLESVLRDWRRLLDGPRPSRSSSTEAVIGFPTPKERPHEPRDPQRPVPA